MNLHHQPPDYGDAASLRVTQAVRSQFSDAPLYPPEMTGQILTRLEQHLGLPVSVPPEPPFEQFPPRPVDVREGVYMLRALADNQDGGQGDPETANAFLDMVEDMLGLPLSYVSAPQVIVDPFTGAEL